MSENASFPDPDEIPLDELKAKFGNPEPSPPSSSQHDPCAEHDSGPTGSSAQDSGFPEAGSLEDGRWELEWPFASGAIDALTWQRLIDDQLPEPQYQELLATLEQNPELWRDCALAFLEQQAIQRALAPLGSDSRVSLVDHQQESFLREALADFPHERSGEIGVIPASVANEEDSERSPRSVWFRRLIIGLPPAVTAILLLGLMIFRPAPEFSNSLGNAPAITASTDWMDATFLNLVHAFNQLPTDVRQGVFHQQVAAPVSPTVPASPAVFRERSTHSTRRILVLKDERENLFALPVDCYKSHPCDVQ